VNFILNKILKLLCTASILISVLFFVSCRNENSLQLNYSNVWNYAQSRTLQFQCVLNSTEEMDPNVFNTVLTQISGTAALEYNRGSCTFIMQSIKVKITAGEVDFNYDSSAKYTDEKDILRNTPFAILLDKRLVCSFNESGRIINIDGYDAITDALDQQAGRLETAFQIKRTFYDYFREDTLKFLIERITGGIPFEFVTSGSKIRMNSENVLPYGCNFRSVFRYNEITRDCHNFDITGIVTALNEYNGIIFELTGETTGKMKLYESSGSGSPFREGYEQSNLKGTETYPDGQELIERPLSLTCSLQYNILNN